MIQNHFIAPLFADVSKQVLGLEFFDADTIVDGSYRHDIEEGDFYLQFRRPATDIAPLHSYRDEHVRMMPAILQKEGLAVPEVGYVPKRKGTGTAFRLVYIHFSEVNEHRTFFGAHSFYSKPSGWGFTATSISNVDSAWGDQRPVFDGGTPNRKITLRDKSPTDRDPIGFVGKFDAERIWEYFYTNGYLKGSKTQEFHALFRALQSNEPYRPSVVDAVTRTAEKLGIETAELVLT